jgi:hypothetical protein
LHRIFQHRCDSGGHLASTQAPTYQWNHLAETQTLQGTSVGRLFRMGWKEHLWPPGIQRRQHGPQAAVMDDETRGRNCSLKINERLRNLDAGLEKLAT